MIFLTEYTETPPKKKETSERDFWSSYILNKQNNEHSRRHNRKV